MSKAALVRTIDAQVIELDRQYHGLSLQATAILQHREAARSELLAGIERGSAAYWQTAREIMPTIAAIDADRMAKLEAAMQSLRAQKAHLAGERKQLTARAPRQQWASRPVKETAWDRSGRVLNNR